MKTIKRLALLPAFLIAGFWSSSVIAEDKTELAALPLVEYQELKRFNKIPSAERVAQSNLRQKEIIQSALTYSPTARELLASQLAAGQDTLAAKGAKAPQITAYAQSIVTEGDLTTANKNRGSPGAIVQATYTVYDWGRIDANVKGRKESEISLYARQNLLARQVTIDALTTCLELNKQRALLTANIDYVEKIRSLVARLNKVVESDPGRAGELVQTKSRMLQADSSIETVRTKVTEVKSRLDRLLGPNQSYQCDGLGP